VDSTDFDDGTKTDAQPAAAGTVTGGDDRPDVLLDVEQLRVEEISLEVRDLEAHVSLHAEVLDLVRLHVGAEAALGQVSLTIKGVEAKALLKVRLDNVARILDRVLTTIDHNPQIVQQLVEHVGEAAEELGKGTGEAVRDVGRGAGAAVEDVGESAGSAVGELGKGTGEAVRDVGRGAGAGVEDVGESAGSAVGEVAEGAGSAVGEVGIGAGSTAQDVGQGAGSAAQDVSEDAGPAVDRERELRRRRRASRGSKRETRRRLSRSSTEPPLTGSPRGSPEREAEDSS
jgi:hypothetical protein